MAKNPSETVYELTREEMQMPHVIQQFAITNEWKVRVGRQWIPLPEFLKLAPDELYDRVSLHTSAFLAPNAPWTPGAVFGLALRLVGLYLLLQVLLGVIAFVTGISMTDGLPMEMRERFWIRSFLTLACYFVAGAYLVRSPEVIVAWVFKTDRPTYF